MKTKQQLPVVLTFSFFILLLGAWFVFSAIGAGKGLQSLNWPHTQGTVLSTDIKKMPSSKGPTRYCPVIRYSYQVGSTEYSSDKYSRTISRGTIEWAKQIIEQHPVDSKIKVFYKPSNPELSVLKTGLQSDNYWMLLFSSFFLFVVILAFKKQLQQMNNKNDIVQNQQSFYPEEKYDDNSKMEFEKQKHIDMKIKSKWILIVGLVGLIIPVTAQELPLVLDKQGIFEILKRTDYASSDCGFTKPEMAANLQKITDLVAIVRKNTVLAEMKGFDGRVRIYNSIACQQEGRYGVPARISFEFAAWYRLKDGKEVRGLIEPPEWSIYTNTIQPGWTAGFSRKPDFIGVPEKKETIVPGIDVYDGECIVIYDPTRPDYWLPVTVKEAFDVAYAENKRNSDEIQWGYAKKMLDEEWAAIPTEDWNKPATMSGMLSRVGTKTGFPLIMKVNPAYWNKTRPKSDIQFITLRMITNKPFLQKRTKEWLKANSTSYHVARFEESLDMDFVKSLLPLITMK